MIKRLQTKLLRSELLRSKQFWDFCIVTVSIIVLTLILTSIDGFEWLVEFTRTYEDWELDELLIAALLSPAFLTWFAYRRWQEAKLEVEKRKTREFQLAETQEQLSYSSTHDVLTGLVNRASLTEHLKTTMIASSETKMLALVYIDLDGFKSINDYYGRDTGDLLLIALADRMKRTLRSNDILARFGGDEFVVILDYLTDTTDAHVRVKRLLQIISIPLHLDDHIFQISACMGVTFYPQTDTDNADRLIRQADQALHQAKIKGKGQYHCFDLEHDRYTRDYHANLEDIHRGLDKEEFLFHYQPKVNMRTGKVIGAEALIRWQHPDKGLLMPGQFLPLIEDHPLSIELGVWVIKAALEQMKKWQIAGQDIPVSINIGPDQLMQPNFIEHLQTSLDARPELKPENLTLEVLETSTIKDINHVTKIIHGCQALGVKFALDDFGTGYSSLTYLKRLPVHLLKIDRSFVEDMIENPEDLSIIKGILALANTFERQVIAEGVETIEHGQYLLQIGCELAQGYGIARPMPAEALPDWINNWKPDPSWKETQCII